MSSNSRNFQGLLQTACAALGFDIGEIWIANASTSHPHPSLQRGVHGGVPSVINLRYHQLYLFSVYEEIFSNLLKPENYLLNDELEQSKHVISPLICKCVCDGGRIVWMNSLLPDGIKNFICTAVGIPVCSIGEDLVIMILISVRQLKFSIPIVKYLSSLANLLTLYGNDASSNMMTMGGVEFYLPINMSSFGSCYNTIDYLISTHSKDITCQHILIEQLLSYQHAPEDSNSVHVYGYAPSDAGTVTGTLTGAGGIGGITTNRRGYSAPTLVNPSEYCAGPCIDCRIAYMTCKERFHELLVGILCFVKRFHVVELWLKTEDQPANLVVVSAFHTDPKLQLWAEMTNELVLGPGDDLPGMVAKRGIPVVDTEYDSHALGGMENRCYKRAGYASSLGLKTAFGIPILSQQQQVCGVLTFYSKKLFVPSQLLINMMLASAQLVSRAEMFDPMTISINSCAFALDNAMKDSNPSLRRVASSMRKAMDMENAQQFAQLQQQQDINSSVLKDNRKRDNQDNLTSSSHGELKVDPFFDKAEKTTHQEIFLSRSSSSKDGINNKMCQECTNPNTISSFGSLGSVDWDDLNCLIDNVDSQPDFFDKDISSHSAPPTYSARFHHSPSSVDFDASRHRNSTSTTIEALSLLSSTSSSFKLNVPSTATFESSIKRVKRDELDRSMNDGDLSGTDFLSDTSTHSLSSSTHSLSNSSHSPRASSRKCHFDGCTKCAQGATKYCIAHGGGRRCIVPGCNKGARDKNYCAAHGGGKRCIILGCMKSAVGGSQHCTAHGGGKRCQYEGCTKSAQSSTYYCVKHGGGRKCAVPECTKVSRGKTLYCASHGEKSICAFPSCGRQAIHTKKYCKAHVVDNLQMEADEDTGTAGTAVVSLQPGDVMLETSLPELDMTISSVAAHSTSDNTSTIMPIT